MTKKITWNNKNTFSALHKHSMQLIQELCNIETKTFQEKKIIDWLTNRFKKNCPRAYIYEKEDNLIIQLLSPNKKNSKSKHIALVGHCDVVPPFFTSFIKGNRIYGAGASDMKGTLAIFIVMFEHYYYLTGQGYRLPYEVSLVVYSREEGTSIEQNGLNSLIRHRREYFENIDLGIVGEPTDNDVQLGCVGSIHALVTVEGKACHSARPWHGQNALYTSLPFIEKMSLLPEAQKSIYYDINGLKFYETMHITESHSEKGRTSLPGYWQANINYRYASNRSMDDARLHFIETLIESGANKKNIRITDHVYAGKIVPSALLDEAVKKIKAKIKAKQAWTDVAQLAKLNISAFNYGAGSTSEAHKNDEHIKISLIKKYINALGKFLLTD